MMNDEILEKYKEAGKLASKILHEGSAGSPGRRIVP